MKKYKPTVLIVDDVQENIQVLGTLLEKHGIDIVATDNGKQSIILSKRLPIDLILLDVVMPEMNGFEVARQLKASQKTREIPIIFITGKTETEDILEGFESGGVDYVTKPIKEMEVLARVHTHLELKKHRDHLEDLVAERTMALEKARIEAESADEAKTRFFVNVHHELKTPLNGIMGMNTLLLDTNLDADQKDYAESIKTSAEAQLIVIDDILHFTEVIHDQIHLEENPLNIRTIVKDVYDLLDVRARDNQIEFTYSVDRNIPDELIGDSRRLRHVLLNISSNAIKFTKNGTVDIHAQIEKEDINNVLLAFVIKDTGIGIREDQMEQLFLPYFQLDDTLTRKYGGLGLGLSNAKEIIERMDGEIGIKSTYGEGTTFNFTVNLQKNPQ